MEPQDRDLLIRIDERVGHLVDSDTNQEKRITTLEHWRWTLTGGFAAMVAFIKYGL